MSFRKPRKSRRVPRPVIIEHDDQRLEDRSMRAATRAEEHATQVVHDAEDSIAGPDRHHHNLGPGGQRQRHSRYPNATEAVEAAERVVHAAERTVEEAVAHQAQHQYRAIHQAEEAMERAIDEAQRQATRAVKVAEHVVAREQ